MPTPANDPRPSASRNEFRVGLGEDTHRLVDGGPLKIGGISIPHDRHLEGHSDADVLLHAITDALLGAAGLPDIGQLFPNTLEENRGRDSAELLREAANQIAQAGWQVVNIDAVVAAEVPRIAPHKEAICLRVASILGIESDRINLKAKTGEGVGPIGRREAIDARSVALLAPRSA